MTWTEVFATHAPTREQLHLFDRDGFLVLPNILGPAEVDALRARADRLACWHSDPILRRLTHAALRVPKVRDRIPTTMPLSPGSVEYHNILGQPGLGDLVDRSTVLPLVTELLGWNIYVYLASLVITEPRPPNSGIQPGPTGWHQDSSRVNADVEGDPRPRLSLKAAYFLTDTRDGHPAPMWVIPGSHLFNAPPADPIAAGAQPLRVAAGSVVVFDRRLWHSASANLSSHDRVVVFVGYAYRWLRPHDNMASRHLWRRTDPIRRQLLGAGRDATSHYSPDDADVPLRALVHETNTAVREESR